MTEAEDGRKLVDELRRELRSAEAREAAVRDVIQTIARSTFDVQTVLQTVIDRSVELCDADSGNIARLDDGVFRVTALRNLSPEYTRLVLERVYVPERGSVIGRTALERRVVQIADVLEDPEYELSRFQEAGGYRTLLGVPMLRDGVPIGVIAVARNEVRPFSDAEIRLLETFADQVVVAIEQVRLFQTVERQRAELARFAPQVASLLTIEGGEQLLSGHRREITALFCDLRGFTAFAETAEPEELFGVLRQYHEAVGELVVDSAGTVEHFAGDGLLAFWNDPTPIPDHELVAVRTALAMRERFAVLADGWRKRGWHLGLGTGLATGYATLGRIGFESRYDYAAIGSVVNLAARLSDAAGPGEILLSQRTHAAVEEHVATEPMAELSLKGFSRPVVAVRAVAGLG